MKLNKKMGTIPAVIYGTAWKEDATERLVRTAIKLGFRGIDTANQRRHYNEAAVGSAMAHALKKGMKREELFIQTKYTYAHSQDQRVPYDMHADYSTQVLQSFQSSLEHLQTNYIDSYILHGPSVPFGVTQVDWQVWRAMESICKEGRIKYLGVSNVNKEQLNMLFEGSHIKPTFVQNRCFAQQGWDKEVREFCKKNKMIYQGFSLLTANPFVLPKVKKIADKLNKTPAQVVLKFSMQIGILPLTGTTSQAHMKEDLALDFTLNDKEVDYIKTRITH
jgi:diketogulonate reductase-like aldo/keto reductase